MIGYYVHHHGNGHLTRADAVARALGREDLVILTSADASALDRPVVPLPLDTDPGGLHGCEPEELHFAPIGSQGLASRMATVAGWIADTGPRLMVVDVSVEVALLSRLCGVPFVYLRQTGDRSDPAHRMAYRWAAALWAPFERWQEATKTPEWIREKTVYTGSVTRFDGRPRPGPASGRRRALVVGDSTARALGLGTGGSGRTAGGWELRRHPRGERINLEDLAWADVVAGPAGNNLVSEVAFARRGLLCVPEQRPFGEQAARAASLRDAGAAEVLDPRKRRLDLDPHLASAAQRAGELERWSDGHGAGRAAAFLARLAEDQVAAA